MAGAEPAAEAGLAELAVRLRGAESVAEFVAAVDDHGWTVPVALLFGLGLLRGGFEYLTDPFVVAAGYRFPGWPVALLANLVFGLALVAFAWFLFFGVVGALAGRASEAVDMDPAVFKVGSYLSTLFVPVIALGCVLALTLEAPETAVLAGERGLDGVGTRTGYGELHDTLQLHVVRVLRGAVWATIGFLLLPVVRDRYDIDRGQSVLAVLPPTLCAVVATQLV